MALSTISLTPGMRANLFSLQQTSKDFEIVQKRLSTGLRINSALDDPINFFTAQEHRLRASDLAARKDGMSEAIQTIKAANVGVENINSLIAQAKSLGVVVIDGFPKLCVGFGFETERLAHLALSRASIRSLMLSQAMPLLSPERTRRARRSRLTVMRPRHARS